MMAPGIETIHALTEALRGEGACETPCDLCGSEPACQKQAFCRVCLTLIDWEWRRKWWARPLVWLFDL